MAPVLSAGENVYEDIGPESQIVRNLIRTESQDSIAAEKERVRIELLDRPLPDTPSSSSSTNNNN